MAHARLAAEPARRDPVLPAKRARERELRGVADRSALERMLDVHGSSGFVTSHRLQRHWRDIAVASRHRQLSPYLAVEAFGRALTGVS